MTHLVRHNTDESLTIGRLTDGEKNHVAAEAELLHLLGGAVKKHIPQLAVNDESLENAVGAAELVHFFAAFAFVAKNMLPCKVTVDLIVFDNVAISRVVTRKRNAGRLQILNVSAVEIAGS